MSSEIRLRRAGVRDLGVVLGMVRELARQHAVYDARRFVTGGGDPAEIERLYAEWLAASETDGAVVCVVAESAGVVGRGSWAGADVSGAEGGGVAPGPGGGVGYFIAEHLPADPRYFSAACAYLHDIYMAPEARGSGLGRRMMAELRAWAASRGVSQVRAMVWPGNDRALGFFAAEGFRETSVELTWDPPTPA